MKEIYILADSYNREIFMTKYDTYEEAYQAMKGELDNVLGFDSVDDEAAAASGLEREIDYDLCSFSAWANAKHSDNDWVIEKFVI
jgi:hypothetical protein